MNKNNEMTVRCKTIEHRGYEIKILKRYGMLSWFAVRDEKSFPGFADCDSELGALNQARNRIDAKVV